jgi:hypothetical protein
MNRLTCINCGDTYPDFDVAHVCSKGPYAYKIKSMSNNKIEELEKQCWSHRVDGALVDGQLHFDTKKFAELIVAKVLDEVATRAYVSGDRAWSDDADRPWIELEFGFGKLAEMKK